MSGLPCIVGTGPRMETCGGCSYWKHAPRDPKIDAQWRKRCVHPNGHRVPREDDDPACQNFTGAKSAALSREALP